MIYRSKNIKIIKDSLFRKQKCGYENGAKAHFHNQALITLMFPYKKLKMQTLLLWYLIEYRYDVAQETLVT